MIKFEHSIFALPFAYLGLFLAESGKPRAGIFWGVTLAMVSFRTMGMALNRLIDAQIDAQNPRTRGRAIPAGLLKPGFVWLVTAVSFVIFIASCFPLNPACLQWAWVPCLLALLYPFTKRFTWFSHFVLGMILALAPYGAWLASRGVFSWVPGLISLGVFFWVAGFDMIYALQDMAFDRERGLFSFPARFGEENTFRLTRVLHVLTVAAWFGAGLFAGLGWIYFAGIFLVSLFLLREHWLIRSFGLQKIQEAFFNMNAVISVTVFVMTLIDLSLRGI